LKYPLNIDKKGSDCKADFVTDKKKPNVLSWIFTTSRNKIENPHWSPPSIKKYAQLKIYQFFCREYIGVTHSSWGLFFYGLVNFNFGTE
jgi:hypothetical protein